MKSLSDVIAAARARVENATTTLAPTAETPTPAEVEAAKSAIGAILSTLAQLTPRLESAVAVYLASRPDSTATRALHRKLTELDRAIGEQCARVSHHRVMHDPRDTPGDAAEWLLDELLDEARQKQPSQDDSALWLADFTIDPTRSETHVRKEWERAPFDAHPGGEQTEGHDE